MENTRKTNIRLCVAAAAVVLPLILGGCVSVGPDYKAPASESSSAWHTELRGGLAGEVMEPSTLASWWTTLNDPALSELIDRAIKGNLDLKKAAARVREARAQLGVTRAGFFPSIDATGSATRSLSSANMGVVSPTTGTSSGIYTNLFSVGFDATWEIDVFGGVRRSVEAAEGDAGAAREKLHDTLVSLLAETATNYVSVRAYQARIAVVEANIESQKGTFELVMWRNQAGLADELAVEEARYNLENTKSQLPTLRTGMEEAMNRIAVLLGEKPGAIHGVLERPGAVPVIPPKVAVGVPADIIRRRPDIRQAERELAAQTARIGVAVAELYPKLTLNGSIGLESLTTNKLLSSDSKTFNVGPNISLPIFHGGALRRNIDKQWALHDQALIQYETTVLNALEQVENVITAYAEEQRRRDALKAAEESARNAAFLARGKYEAGLTDFLSVLVAERSLLTFQNDLVQSNATVANNFIRLYKALGGGWDSPGREEKKNDRTSGDEQ